MENQNLEEPQVTVKQEPPVEFVLILPRPTNGWPAIKKEEDVKSKRWVKSVNVAKFDAKWQGESIFFQTFFTCPHCQIVVKTQGYLTQHLRTCSKLNQARFECDICGERFQQKWFIRKHMRKHSNEKKFCCTKCGFRFKTKEGLLHHSRSKRIHKCAVCDVTFSCKLLMKLHRSEFHGNMFKCDECSFQTKRKDSLINHKGTHDKPMTCETCQKKFPRNELLKVHQMNHKHGTYATAPEETFDCDKCDKSYSSRMCLKQHQRVVHDENAVKCKVCDKICKNRNALYDHSRSHIKVECSICYKRISKHSLTLHMQLHSGIFFECDLCEYSTKAKSNLRHHIERKHLLMKLEYDLKCRENFSNFELLEKLQLRHGSSATSIEKKFKCDLCKAAFVIPITAQENISR